MHKVRLVTWASAILAVFLLALAAAGVAAADDNGDDNGGGGTPAPACDVTGIWDGLFFGTLGGGVVSYEIFNQQQGGGDNGDDNGDDDGNGDDNGDDDGNGDDNGDDGGNGDDNGDDGGNGGNTSTFEWSTIFVSNFAEASGTGTLTLTDTGVLFSIEGRGSQPLGGDFTLTADGTVFCSADRGLGNTAIYNVDFDDPNVPDDNGSVSSANCSATESEICVLVEPPPT